MITWFVMDRYYSFNNQCVIDTKVFDGLRCGINEKMTYDKFLNMRHGVRNTRMQELGLYETIDLIIRIRPKDWNAVCYEKID